MNREGFKDFVEEFGLAEVAGSCWKKCEENRALEMRFGSRRRGGIIGRFRGNNIGSKEEEDETEEDETETEEKEEVTNLEKILSGLKRRFQARRLSRFLTCVQKETMEVNAILFTDETLLHESHHELFSDM